MREMGTYAAQGFLRNAQVRSDHAQWYAVDKGGMCIHQLLVTLLGGSKMQVIEPLLHLYQTDAQQQPAQPFNVMVLAI